MADGKVVIDVDFNGAKAESGVTRLKGLISGMGNSVGKVGNVFKSVLGANLVSGAISSGIGVITNGIHEMVGELTGSTKAWKTFEGNMSFLGKSESEINSAKAAMQDYATKTIYSASDMASTYSQLAAVGIENVDKLVTGFGGLAAASENPKQAMKTLSQQATQMAAKPSVQWADFKLMLEQTPAGIAAVAKQMGMSTSELVTAVGKGKIATKDFFDAIQKVGNNPAFSKMATEFKTVGQAIDGLKEGLSNKLQPAFERLNQAGIKMVSSLADNLDKIDFSALEANVGRMIVAVKAHLYTFIKTVKQPFMDLMGVFGNLNKSIFSAFGDVFNQLGGKALTAGERLGNIFNGIMDIVRKATVEVTGFINALKANGTFKAVGKALQAVGEAIGHVFSLLKGSGAGLASVVGVVVTAVAQLVQKFAELVSAIPQEWIDTIAAGFESAASAIGNFIQSFANTGVFEAVEQAIQSIETAIRRVIEAFGELFNGFSADGSGFGTVIGEIVKGLANAAKAVADFISSLDSGTIQKIGGTILGLIVAVKSAVLAVKGFNFLKNFNPFKIFTKNSEEALGGLGKKSSSAAQIIKSVFTGIGNIIKNIANGIKTVLTPLPKIINAVGNIVKSIANVMKTAIATIPRIINSVGNAAKGIGQGLSSVFNGLGKGISEAAKGIGEGIGAIFKGIGKGLALVNPVTLLALGAAIAIVVASLALLATQSDGVVAIINALGEAMSLIATTVIGAFASAIDTVVTSVANALVTIQPFVETLGNAMATVAQAIGSAMATIISAIGDAALQIATGFATIISAVADGFSQVISAVGDAVSKIASGFADIINAIGGAVADISGGIAQIVSAVTSGFADVINAIGSAAGQIAKGVADIVKAFGDAAGKVGQAIAEVVKAVSDGVTKIVEAFSKIVSQISPIIDSISDLVTKLGDAISKVFEGAGKAAESFGNGIKNALDGLANVFEAIGTAAEKAGAGFKTMAEGVKIIVDTNLLDLGASLGTVADNLGKMARSATGITELGAGLQTVVSEMTNLANSMIGITTAMTTVEITFATLKAKIDELATAFEPVKTAIETFGTSITTLETALTSGIATLTNFASAIDPISVAITGVGTALSTVQGVLVGIMGTLVAMTASLVASGVSATLVGTQFQMMATTVQTAMTDMTTSVNTMATSIVNELTNAMNQAKNIVTQGMDAIVQVVTNTVPKMTELGHRMGTETVQKIAEGMRSQEEQVSSAMESMVETARNVAMRGVATMESVGREIGNGLAAGMRSALDAVTAAADALVAQAERAARAKAMIHSPSRLFRDRVGRYIAQGMAVGIENNSNSVTDALGYVHNKMLGYQFNVEDILGVGKSTVSAKVKAQSFGAGQHNSGTVTHNNQSYTFNANASGSGNGMSREEMMRLFKEFMYYMKEGKMV